MRCAQVASLVERYIDGALSLKEAAAVDMHIGTCPSCAEQIATARRLVAVLGAEPMLKAPRDFADRVMEAVYRQQPSAERVPLRAPLPVYRRLGLSFVLTAIVLTASLLIPSVAYPSFFGGQRTEVGAARTVKRAIASADSAVRGILGGQETGGTQ